MKNYDIIIIGRGPAGLSAAIYCCRAGLSVGVIGFGNGALEKAALVQNYFGFAEPISGKELLQKGTAQARRLGAVLIDSEVVDITWNNGYEVTAVNDRYKSKAVILATGAERKKLSIPGIDEYEGKGVSYCAICDAFFFRDKRVAVIGSGEYALHELNHVLSVAESAVLLTAGASHKAAIPAAVDIITKEIKSVFGGENVQGVEFSDGSKIEVDGVFVATGSAAADDLARKLGAHSEDGVIIVDDKMAASLPGLYAAGDCTGGTKQISVAVGEGAKAALGAIDFLKNLG